MKDITGKPLAIGDIVAVPFGSGRARSLLLGCVIRCGTKMVVLEGVSGSFTHTVRRYPTDVAIVQL